VTCYYRNLFFVRRFIEDIDVQRASIVELIGNGDVKSTPVASAQKRPLALRRESSTAWCSISNRPT